MRAGVVGCGIMGRWLALALREAGWQVTLFDQFDGFSNCSNAAAGLLTPYSELDKADAVIFHLGQESINTHWPRLLNDLSDDIYFRHHGSLVLNHPKDQTEWQHFSRRITTQLGADSPYYQHLNRSQLADLEPELHRFENAYYLHDEAQLDCQTLLRSLTPYSAAKGVQCHLNTPVLTLNPGTITTAHQQHQFDWVFDCRGLGAQSAFPDLRGIRGELLWLHAPDVQLHRPVRLLHPRYNLYIVPRPNHTYLIGASEIEAEDFSPISVRTTLELLTAAYYVHTGFAEARVIKSVTECRPTLTTHRPKITHRKGLTAINGLYRHGYLIAPALAIEVIRGLNSASHDLHYPDLWETKHDLYLHQ